MSRAQDQIVRQKESIERGLDFIYRVAATVEGFEGYGNLLICCFALVAATSRDASLREMARCRARKLAQRWRRTHRVLPLDASARQLWEFVLVSYALGRLGLRDIKRNAQIRAAAKRFSTQELLGFNPVVEPPPSDLSSECKCGLQNQRGRTFCKECRKRLEIQSRYRGWMAALTKTHVSERCGVTFGAPYVDVVKWLPAMRPYPVNGDADVEFLREAIYAVTHVVYTLNNYGAYRLSPRWLPQEFAFLKANVLAACERKDPEILGELLDSLRAFGLRDTHPLIRRGAKYLLAEQNEDGSWGDLNEENIRTRCHTTWTAIDGLRAYAWRGERLSHPEVKAMVAIFKVRRTEDQ